MKRIVVYLVKILLFKGLWVYPAFGQSPNEIEQIRDYIGLSKTLLGVNNLKAHEMATKALESARLADVDSLKAKAHRFCGLSSYYRSDLNQSLKHYDSAIYYYTQLNDKLNLARIYNSKGAVFTQLNQFHKAISHYLTAKDIYLELNNEKGLVVLYNNIGSLYQYLHDFENAKLFYKKAIDAAEAGGFTEEAVNALSNITVVYEFEHRLAEAEKAYRAGINMAKSLPNSIVSANINTNFGSFWIEQKQPDSALRYLLAAKQLFRDSNLNLAKLYLSLARAYHMKGQRDQALNYYFLAKDNALKGTDAVLRLRILKELAETMALRGNFQEAYHLLTDFASETDLFRNESDSLKNVVMQLHFSINDLEQTADTLRSIIAEAEVTEDQLSSRSKTKTILLIMLAVLFIIITGMSVYLFRAFRKQKEHIQSLNQEIDAMTAERDILKRHEIELESQRKLLHALIESSPNPLGIKNGNNVWLLGNDAMCRIMGVNSGQLNGLSANDLASISSRSASFFRMLEVSEEIVWMKGRTVRSEETLTDGGGDNLGRYIVMRVPVIESSGTRKFLVSYFIPTITTPPNNEKVVKSGLISILSRLSHEIRTPLNVVLGFGDLITSNKVDPVKKRQYSRILQREGAVLLKLVDDLMLYTSLQMDNLEVKTQTFDFSELFVNLHTRLINSALELGKPNLEIRLDIPQSPCAVSLDEVLCRLMLNYLADNAVRYTQTGQVTIGYRFDDSFEKRLISVFVKDTGPGIPIEMQKTVFEPFIRLPHSQGHAPGLGLGLSIVKLIAEKLNVRLQLKSEFGKGSLFELQFDVRAMAPENIIKPHTEERYKEHREGKLSGKKVLVVEDDESNSELLRIILEGVGARFIHASTGEEAIEKCMQTKDIDLVLMDIHLPKMSGLEATRQIKSLRADLPIIAHTAYVMANEKDACFEAGCDGYVAKPIKPKLLLPILEQLFE